MIYLKFILAVLFIQTSLAFRSKPIVIGITGCSCSGKTTLATLLYHELTATNHSVIYIKMDDFYLPRNETYLSIVPEIGEFNYDRIDSFNLTALHDSVNQALWNSDAEFVIIEGILLFRDPYLFSQLDFKYFITLGREEIRRRRLARRNYQLDTHPSYFDLVVWPEYIKYKAMCETLYPDEIVYLSGRESSSMRKNFDFILNNLSGILNPMKSIQ